MEVDHCDFLLLSQKSAQRRVALKRTAPCRPQTHSALSPSSARSQSRFRASGDSCGPCPPEGILEAERCPHS
eukprot:2441288-Pleurochrysis_carterae.AAC.1